MNNRVAEPSARRVLTAYRDTSRSNAGALAEDNGTWLQVGSLIEHAGFVTGATNEHLAEAARLIRGAIGEAAWQRGHITDPQTKLPKTSLESRIRVFCERIEDAGALDLADAILSVFVSIDHSVPEIELGRIEAVRARLAWKRGDLDVAGRRYRRVATLAGEQESVELRVRAWTGQAQVARFRGNFPQCRMYARKAARAAHRSGFRPLASVAHQVLMVAAVVAEDFVVAIEHGWHAYRFADGELSLEAAALGNIGQAFLDAGHPETASAAFATLIERKPPNRVILPAYGGLAVAAARLGRTEVLRATTLHLLARAEGMGQSAAYDLATVMLDLALAYTIVGDAREREEYRTRAAEMAVRHGFNEILVKAETLPRVASPTPAPRPLPPLVEAVAGEVRHLARA